MNLPTLLVSRVLLRRVALGTECVILFFIMSGFVLALPYRSGRNLSYPRFLLRRIFRIYLPYLASLVLAVTGAWYFHGRIHLDEWFDQTWSEPVSWRLVWQHVLFLGRYNADQFNSVFWSLVVELRISLIFPFLCMLVFWLPDMLVIAGTIALYLACGVLFPQSWYWPAAIGGQAPYFIGGILMAKNLEALRGLYRGLSRRIRMLLGFAIGFLFSYGLAAPRILQNRLVGSLCGLAVFAAAEWILLAVLSSPTLQQRLAHSFLRHLGRIPTACT
jgi:peptidoglycan/LPS O-acetylase OafA/YrhL